MSKGLIEYEIEIEELKEEREKYRKALEEISSFNRHNLINDSQTWAALVDFQDIAKEALKGE